MKPDDKNFCLREDATGRVCFLGKDHSVACQFGGVKLTEGQQEALREFSRGGSIEVFVPSQSLHALARRGLVKKTLIGMRWWRVNVTKAGMYALQTIEASDNRGSGMIEDWVVGDRVVHYRAPESGPGTVKVVEENKLSVMVEWDDVPGELYFQWSSNLRSVEL